ncbi:MAG: hypothetical protein D6813_07850 [Calditrichaeota bacterium]|nr:MAG: hypothetical protein D6813_07850 [Calditrichota bacterium]
MARSSDQIRKVKSFPRDTLEQAKVILEGWNKVGNKLLVPNLSVDEFVKKLQEAEKSVEKAEELKILRAKAIEERNQCLSELWDLTKRIKNAAKATFGDYSPELELLLAQKKEDEKGKMRD